MTSAVNKIRYDTVFVSSLLFTVALLFPVPELIKDAMYKKDALLQAVGFASLANILVGILVAWTGFIRRFRIAWLVMFIIVWVWAFPVLILPLFEGKIDVTLAEWLADAWHRPGSGRIYAENIVLFSTLALALLLPLKSFFWKGACQPGSEYR
jgi:hypothetical protein